MQRSTLALMGSAMGLALVALPLGGCTTDDYGYGSGYTYSTGVAWNDYPYDVYYDDYYGPIYDGYWGGDGYFYYRGSANDRGYHRGDNRHFRHDRGDNNYRRYQGSVHQPSTGTRMPYYPGNRGDNGNGGNHGDNGHRRGHR